jgi:hypothetical protein
MEAMIRKQRERELTKNKASAFRVRKRPVNQEKINRYISEHLKRPGSNDDLDIEMEIDSAGIIASIFSKNATIDDANNKCIVTPAGVSVYTPSDTGPRTPLAAASPQGNSNEYSAASHSLRFPPKLKMLTCISTAISAAVPRRRLRF